MTFNPIHAMALKSAQIDIPAQTIASATTLTLGSITDSSVITVSSNIINLPSGRDYFLTASLNFAQATGNNVEFAFINASGGTTFANQTKAYAYYDIAGIPTVCMGYTGTGIVFGKKYSQEECSAFLKKELIIHASGVLNCITKPLKENEGTTI